MHGNWWLATIFVAAQALGTVCCAAQDQLAEQATEAELRVRQRLAELNDWLGENPNASRWREYLDLRDLAAQLDATDAAAAAVEAGGVIDRLDGGANGLDAPRFAALRAALHTWHTESSAAAELDPQAISLARDQFVAVPADAFAASRDELLAALARLRSYLASGGTNGAAWSEFLRLGDLVRLLASSDTPDAKRLAEVEAQLASGEVGLQLPPFANLRTALRGYLQQLRSQDPQIRQQFQSLVDALAVRLDRYLKNPSSAHNDLRDIGRVLGWLEEHGQSTQLVQWMRRELSQPNLRLHVGEQLIRVGMSRHVDRVTQVNDCILGTAICGTGHTVGRITVRPAVDARRAAFDAVFSGVTTSRTLGSNRSARIRSLGYTTIHARKRLVFDIDGLHALPANSTASTRSSITGVGSTAPGLRGRIVTRIARRKAAQSQGQAEAAGSSHASAEFNRSMDAEAGPQVELANNTYYKLRRRLARRRQFPELMAFATSGQRLGFVAVQADRRQLAAQDEAPALLGQPALAVRLHESVVNNAAFGLLAGETVTQEKLEALLVDLLGKVPEGFATDADQEPWSITLDRVEPVTLRFVDNGFHLTIRGERYTSGDGRYDAMNVAAKYQFDQGSTGLVLRRTEELEILPPKFDPSSGQKLGIRQTTLRNLLKRRFSKIFKTEIAVEGFALPQQFRELGSFLATQHQTAGGWLVLAWRNDPNVEPVLPTEPAGAAAPAEPLAQVR